MKTLREVLVNILLALVIFTSMYILVKEIRQSGVAMQPQQVVVQPVVAQPQTVVQQQPQTAVVALPDKTYFPEFSCSDLSSCTVNRVPDGLMTIGFIRINRNMPNHNCGYAIFTSGQAINYDDSLSEIHTYSGNLPDPATTLESFVESNMPFVHSCN